MEQSNRFIPIAKLDEYHPWPSPGAARVMISKAEAGRGDPAFLNCIVRVRGRVLINEAKFLAWIESHEQPEVA